MIHLTKSISFLSLAVILLSESASGTPVLGGFREVSSDDYQKVQDLASQIKGNHFYEVNKANPVGDYTLKGEIRNAMYQVVAGFNYVFDADYSVVNNKRAVNIF
jgi:hypothetical protein